MLALEVLLESFWVGHLGLWEEMRQLHTKGKGGGVKSLRDFLHDAALFIHNKIWDLIIS